MKTELFSELISEEACDQILRLMWDASDVILDIYHGDQIKVDEKADQSPVTQADLAAHRILVEGLRRITPDIPVVSEEDANSLEIPRRTRTFWLIDPLDGTREFINRNGEFTCNVALIQYEQPIYGFVSIPASELLYHGGPSIGSFRRKAEGSEERIHCKNKAGITRIVASKSHLNDETREFIEAIQGDVELVQAGSSLKFLRIAEGMADLYPRLAPTCEWDTAAAHAILEGAGGSVTQLTGTPLLYGKREILNPRFIATSENTSRARQFSRTTHDPDATAQL